MTHADALRIIHELEVIRWLLAPLWMSMVLLAIIVGRGK